MAKRGLKSAAGIVLGVVIVVPVVAALAVWLWRDDVAKWVVVNYLIPDSGFDPTFDGQFDVELSDTLDVTAADFRITARTPDQPIRAAQIGRLQVALDMNRLLRGVPLLRRLEVGDSVIEIRDREPGEIPGPAPGPRGYRFPFIEAAELSNIRLLRYGSDPDAPPMDEIQLVKLFETTKGGKVEIDGTVIWDGSQLDLQGSLGGTEMALDRSTPYPIDLVVRSQDFTLDLDGTVADVISVTGLDFDVALDAPEISRLSHYANLEIPELGPLKIAGHVGGDLNRIGIDGLTAVVGDGKKLVAKAEGEIADLIDMDGADLALSVWVEDPVLFRSFTPDGKPTPEALEVEGRLVSTAEEAVLQDLLAKLSLPGGVTLDASGKVSAGNVFDLVDPEDIDLWLQLESPTTLAADPWLTLGIEEIGPLTATGQLSGSTRDLSLFGLNLQVGRQPGVRIIAMADLENIDFDDPLANNVLHIELLADDTSDLSVIFETEIPSLGPAHFSFDSKSEPVGEDEFVDRWENLTVRIGRPDTVLIKAEGRLAEWNSKQEPSLRGLDLDAHVQAADLASLEPILGVDLPDGGTADGRLRLTGNSDSIAATINTLDIGFPGALSIRASGDVGQYDSTNGTYGDVNITFDATAPDTGSALAPLGIDLPIEGPLDATVVLASQGNALGLPRAVIQAGPNTEPTLSLDSAVTNVDDPARLKANGAFRINMSRLNRDLVDGDGWDLGLASGAFTLSGNGRGYAIDRFNVAFDRIGALEVGATGEIDPDNEDTPVELDVRIRAASLAQLAADPEKTLWPDRSLKADGRMALGRTRIDYDGMAEVGKSDFSTNLLIDITQPTEVTARIRSQTVYLADLGLENTPLDDDTEETRGAVEQAAVNPVLFGAVPLPIERLGDIDLALSIETGSVIGRDFEMTRVSGQYDLQDGRLTAKTLAFYDKGSLEVTAEVDSNQEPPALAFAAIGDDLTVEEVLTEFGLRPVMEGDLHFNVDVNSRGLSPRDIAHHLGGTATFAVDEGRVQIGDLERISSNRFQAKRANARRSEWTELSCGVIRLNIEEGVAKTDGLVLATPNVVIGGSGQIDLRDETIDLVLAADREFSTAAGFDKPVRVHGPLTDPEVTANISGHVGDAALTGGEVAGMVAMPFIFVPVRVASFLRPQLNENDTSSACLLNGEVSEETFRNGEEPQPIN